MSEDNNKKFIDLPLAKVPNQAHITTLINAGTDTDGNKVRCTVYVLVPSSEEEAKEIFGEGCTMNYIIEAGCRALATRPPYAKVAKDTIENGGSFSDVQVAMQEAMNNYEVNKPRPKKAKLDYDQAIALMAAENGLSIEAIRTAINDAKEDI